MLYWATTGTLAAFLVASALSYLLHSPTIQGIRDLGIPDHVRRQLAVLKLIAVPVLLLPIIPTLAKHWAYAGVALFLVTAIVAHAAHRDPILLNLVILVLLAVLVTSLSTLSR